jgi:type 1 glutamine amidotransferase
MQTNQKRVLMVWGGWDGHTPKESTEFFAEILKAEGYEVLIHNTLAVYTDKTLMDSLSLIVQNWTMGEITGEQEQGLLDAVAAGTGIAGFHGGSGDSFRGNTSYQWMIGGQWVAHPGNLIPEYTIHITNNSHPITTGIADFQMHNTEQYYMHVDPAIQILATTTFADATVMPAVWTKKWGNGKVFYASYGHTVKDFEIPSACEIVKRGMLWASK